MLNAKLRKPSVICFLKVYVFLRYPHLRAVLGLLYIERKPAPSVDEFETSTRTLAFSSLMEPAVPNRHQPLVALPGP